MSIKNNNFLLYIIIISISIITGVSITFSPFTTFLVFTGLIISILIFILLLRRPYKLLTFLSIILILSLFLFPGINIGGIDFRVDDYIAIFFSIALVIIFYKKDNYEIPSIMKWLLVYLVYSLLITTVHILFSGLQPILLLFFIKEIQYFVYFLVFYYLSKNYISFNGIILKTFLVASIMTILWGAYQLITNNIVGYYGIGIISVSSASQSGITFFLIFLFLLYMSVTVNSTYKEILILVASFISLALTFATISRTAISVSVFILFLYLFISMLKKWNFGKIITVLILITLVLPLSIILVGDLIFSVTERFSRFSTGANVRTEFWKEFLEHSNLMGYIFGNGKGFMQEIVGSFTLRADNQYVRLILEIGSIGLILWLTLVFSIIFFSLKNLKYSYNNSLFLLLLTIGFMVIGLTQEGYLVTIQGSLYWILTGFLLGNIMKEKKALTNNKNKI